MWRIRELRGDETEERCGEGEDAASGTSDQTDFRATEGSENQMPAEERSDDGEIHIERSEYHCLVGRSEDQSLVERRRDCYYYIESFVERVVGLPSICFSSKEMTMSQSEAKRRGRTEISPRSSQDDPNYRSHVQARFFRAECEFVFTVPRHSSRGCRRWYQEAAGERPRDSREESKGS